MQTNNFEFDRFSNYLSLTSKRCGFPFLYSVRECCYSLRPISLPDYSSISKTSSERLLMDILGAQAKVVIFSTSVLRNDSQLAPLR